MATLLSYASIFLFVAVQIGSVINKESTVKENQMYQNLRKDLTEYVLTPDIFDISVKLDWELYSDEDYSNFFKYFDIEFRITKTWYDPVVFEKWEDTYLDAIPCQKGKHFVNIEDNDFILEKSYCPDFS